MRNKSFSITVTITLLFSILIPVFIISQYLFLSIKQTHISKAYSEIIRVKQEKVKQIKNFYSQEFHNFEKIIDNIPKDNTLEVYEREVRYLLDFQPNIEQIVMYNYNFKPLINVHRSKVANLYDISEPVRVTIQKNFYFSKYFLKDLPKSDGSSHLVFFFKEVSGSRYYSLILDYIHLNSYLKEFGDIKIDIYNEKYQIVASSNQDFDPRRVHINALTEKLILGVTEDLLYEGSYNSFTHIDLGGEKLFINVHLPKSVVDLKSKKIKMTLMFFYIVFTLTAILMGTILTKYFYHVKEASIRKEVFTDRFGFFFRIKKSIKYIDDRFIEVQKLYKALNFFKNDVSIILEELDKVEIGDKSKTK